MFKFTDCIDSGTDYCPCSLGEMGECLICSQLNDLEFCDCLNWKGTCIYQELINNNNVRKKQRSYKSCTIINREYLRKDILKLDIRVSSTLARELDNIGAFVFLKNPVEGEGWSTPISIMESDVYYNTITVVVKIVGIKTKSLEKCENKIMVKGPYWNGIQGVRFINNIEQEACLVLARGCAAAPLVMASKKLVSRGNKVFALLDRGRSEFNFSKRYIIKNGCNEEDVSFYGSDWELTDEIKYKLKEMISKEGIKLVICGGEDEFYRKVISYIYSFNNRINFSTVNNSSMCCGEGICGSCQVETWGREKIRSCKQQYNPVEVFLEGMGIK